MTKRMLIDALHTGETRMVIAEDEFIEDFDFVTSSKQQLKGNIYLAKITRVEPSLQAAFVEYGGNKQGFLPFSEIHPDYYQIPVEDRKKLIEEEAEETAREEAAEEEAIEQRESRKGRDEQKGGRGRRGRYGRRRRSRRDGENRDEESSAEATATADENPDNQNPYTDADDPNKTEYQATAAVSQETRSEPIGEGNETAGIQASNEPEEAAAEEEERIETVSDDDMEETRTRRKGKSFKRYRIQEVIKRNQVVLVQVIKEERGNKGVSLTTYISLAGRYCVLMPNSPKAGGVSRKIANGDQRRKLKDMVAELRKKRGLSAIIRTAGIDRTRAEIKRDYEYLVKLWQQIREDTLASTAPALIYQESDIIKRAIRDLYTNDIEQVLVQGEQAYKDAKGFMKLIMPSHAPRVKHYKDQLPIFSTYGIEEQLDSMYEASAKLSSGGYIVLHPTEALISIDVNSGRSTTERNVEETAIKTNLEAAKEIARQLRLRDLAGLIVIDFIDMYYGRNRRSLEKAMREALKHDRAKIQMSRISAFGLMELSRQRLRPSIAESSSVICPHCEGTGSVRSVETMAIQIIRLLEREAVAGEYSELKVLTSPDAVLHLFNYKRDMIRSIEEQYEIQIVLQIDPSLLAGRFRLVKITPDGKEIAHEEEKDRGGKRKGRRGKRGGRSRQEGGGEQKGKSADQTDQENEDDDNQADEFTPRAGKRRRKVVDDAESDDDTGEAGEQSDDDASPTPRRRSSGSKSRGGRQRSSRSGRKSKAQKSDDGEVKTLDGDEVAATADNDNEPEPANTPATPAVAVSTASDERTAKEDAVPEGVIIDSMTKSVVGEAPGRPKRRGWWNRS